MDRLSSCYFCGGALDASLSEYPVVPKELQPADGDSPTVVLCSTCRRKLGAVIEEVVAATEDGAPATGEAATGGLEPDEALARSTADDGVSAIATADSGAPATDDSATPESASATDDSGVSATDDSAASSSTGTESTAGRDESGGSGPSMTKLEYNKVMRLLKNRPFPVDKAEIREVATSAYDIDQSEFEAVIDAAVSRGLIAERNGQFVEAE